jgi:alanine racemase
MPNNHVTTLEIDLNAVDFNLNYFKSKVKTATKILAVVKAFGYGSDDVEIAKHLTSKVDYFAVAYADEGITLRNAGIQNPILVLHPQIQNLALLIQYNLEPNLYSFNILEAFITVLKEKQIVNYPVHLKFNTGLNRLGFIPSDVSKIADILKNTSYLKVSSTFSHIAASEDLNEQEFTLKQLSKFKSASEALANNIGYRPMRHMTNTSAVINFSEEAQFNMVRVGIGLYGFGNDNKETRKLQNVIQLKSVISQIHTVYPGETVGYNRAFRTEKTIKTATIPIGHADGILRQFGNGKGYVYINNKKAFIIGNVCMDMLMVDITTISCSEGDEVYIYKNQEHIEDLSQRINTIPYELLTAISNRVRRTLKKC